MRIGALQRTHRDSWDILYAKVTLNAKDIPPLPEILWFKVESRYGNTTSADGLNSFLLALVFPAMLLGEPIELDGPVSAELVEGVLIVQQIFHNWYPELKPVPIRHSGQHPALPKHVVHGNGCCFSGGVDSLFSIKSFLDHPIPQIRHTHLFYGLFGPPFTYNGGSVLFEESVPYYRSFVEKMGLEFVSGSSNLSDFSEPLHLWWSNINFGVATAAMAHMLPGLFSRFIIPGSHFHRSLYASGSSPETDPLLSSELVKIINHGSSVTRLEKTVIISQWEPAYHILNVCVERNHPLINCGRCEKCWRVILTLICVDSLEKFSTFNFRKDSQDRLIVAGWHPDNLINSRSKELFYQDILEFAALRGKDEVVGLVREALAHYEEKKRHPEEPDQSHPLYTWMRQFRGE